ncbi:MAG: exopolysaccharide biosynthesis polyprenyl glycosylphosphotransferase [Candidatus Krumholzibacteria bacterium]|nr:exopolysaccharide biosynthesis polyprenyl glycosylphosphotransferase [Candidatus Krumholzibacteria bacterium]
MSVEQKLDKKNTSSEVVATDPPDRPHVKIRSSPAYEICKRLFDLTVGCVVMVLLLPIIPLIAIMIKLDSPGPVFFEQNRVGRYGRIFRFYKFRSMYREAERQKQEFESLNEQEGPVFKIRSDPRVTSVGGFLRRSSLDEIPQILNVLKGDMSLVGPRPHMPSEVAQYEPWHRQRLEIKPGITCLWQISGRSHVNFEEWMRLDIEYLRSRSFMTDLSIIVKTLPAVIQRKGAY